MSKPFLISDMISAIRNIKEPFQKKVVKVKYSKLCEKSLFVLKKEGYISDYKVYSIGNVKYINVFVRFLSDLNCNAINSFKIISKPSLRVYFNKSQVDSIIKKNGLNLVVVSTDKGVMSINDAKKNNSGGEILFSVFCS